MGTCVPFDNTDGTFKICSSWCHEQQRSDCFRCDCAACDFCINLPFTPPASPKQPPLPDPAALANETNATMPDGTPIIPGARLVVDYSVMLVTVIAGDTADYDSQALATIKTRVATRLQVHPCVLEIELRSGSVVLATKIRVEDAEAAELLQRQLDGGLASSPQAASSLLGVTVESVNEVQTLTTIIQVVPSPMPPQAPDVTPKPPTSPSAPPNQVLREGGGSSGIPMGALIGIIVGAVVVIIVGGFCVYRKSSWKSNKVADASSAGITTFSKSAAASYPAVDPVVDAPTKASDASYASTADEVVPYKE